MASPQGAGGCCGPRWGLRILGHGPQRGWQLDEPRVPDLRLCITAGGCRPQEQHWQGSSCCTIGNNCGGCVEFAGGGWLCCASRPSDAMTPRRGQRCRGPRVPGALSPLAEAHPWVRGEARASASPVSSPCPCRWPSCPCWRGLNEAPEVHAGWSCTPCPGAPNRRHSLHLHGATSAPS